MNRLPVAILLTTLLLRGLQGNAADDFEWQIQPFLKTYCITCHSTQEQAGELDLQRLRTLTDVRQDPHVAQRMLAQIALEEMPPQDSPQMSAAEKQRLTAWLRATLDEIALASAGDPGAVGLRRLSNAEYSYSIRDLTGVAAFDPAREFPADGGAGEGFTNAAAALVMSPTLLTKYLDAAKEIAEHAVLLPDTVAFSPSTSANDWATERLTSIRDFYGRYARADGAMAVDLQGVKFETNAGGRLPLERYLAALHSERQPLQSNTTTVAAVAQANDLNAKYLDLLWQTLSEPQDSIILRSVQEKWNAGTLSPADIRAWQQALWRFTSVGHIGKLNGPKQWQEPLSPLVDQHEIRHKLTAPADGSELVVYLIAGEAGDGSEGDFVLWDQPRIVLPGGEQRPLEQVVGAQQFSLQAPSVIEVRLPAALAADSELVVTGRLHSSSGGSVQLQVLSGRLPEHAQTLAGLAALDPSLPIIVGPQGPARQRLERACEDFRQLFPAALCYAEIVPVDEVVTLTLYHREDEHLQRLMLDEQQVAELDRLWDELLFVSHAPLKLVDAFEQLYQYATQDADPSAFEPLRIPIRQSAEVFRERLLEVQPRQVEAVLELACRAWRRPLSDSERSELRVLYKQLREQELPHETAVRMLIVRVLVAPNFLYRGEKTAAGADATPVSSWELATRLSYFLWSSVPDGELRGLADSGRLAEPEVLAGQVRRMMRDPKIRRLALEFGCQWLQVRDLATLDEKSERHFPTFKPLRADMQEEVVRFFVDLFQEDRSVLSLLDADHSFVNGALASHYGLEPPSQDWQRVSGMRAQNRGGILGFAAALAKQSGASRTSPILRGIWLSEVVLGEKLPPPPKDIPILPEEPPVGLTERELTERHSSDPACAGCHRRIDPFGFALEGFDAIGRWRERGAGGLALDTGATLADGTVLQGVEGVRAYLLDARREDFLRQFSRKLLGFSLGRSVQLSDQPLIDTMLEQLAADDDRVSTAIELIVGSPQFQRVRGQDFIAAD